MARDKGPFPLFPNKNVGRDKGSYTRTDREYGDAEAFRKLAFRRQLVAGFPFSFRQAL